MEKNIKKAMDLAEQEVQEKEIQQLKSIIKDLLQKKVNKEEEKREVEKEISVIKQTIDDFKAGRLDKVKDLIEKDAVAKDLLPFKIIIINQPVYTQPWNWVYQVQPINVSPNYTYTTLGSNSINLCNASTVDCTYTSATSLAGTTASNFAGGTYSLDGGRIINL